MTTRSLAAWRLLIHPPADGAWNMAVDEALLEAYRGRAAPQVPTVRLYGWSPPALSLGRAQPSAGAHAAAYLREEGIGLVRRPTGGRAVLHERERTYAVVGGLRSAPFPGRVVETYREIAGALALGLGRLGLDVAPLPPAALRGAGPSCFATAGVWELGVAGRKLVGSAQLRRGIAFLQHGSIPLRFDADRLDRALGSSTARQSATDLTRELGRTPGAGELDEALVCGFEARFGVRLEPGRLTAEESARVERLRAFKYESASWTLAGRIGERERRWGLDD